VSPPFVPEGSEHLYCRYSVYVPDRDNLVRRALIRGVDVETSLADLWPAMPHFGVKGYAPYAAQARTVVQLPVHASLGDAAARRVARRIRSLLSSAVGAPEEVRTDVA
jgi:dTDP-4-amino-4,6-dideoxygalactose transaminase